MGGIKCLHLPPCEQTHRETHPLRARPSHALAYSLCRRRWGGGEVETGRVAAPSPSAAVLFLVFLLGQKRRSRFSPRNAHHASCRGAAGAKAIPTQPFTRLGHSHTAQRCSASHNQGNKTNEREPLQRSSHGTGQLTWCQLDVFQAKTIPRQRMSRLAWRLAVR